MINEPRWVAEGRKYIGTKEYPGPASNPVILSLWKLAKMSGINDDLVPWCAGAQCGILESCGIRSPRSDSARAFLPWGQKLDYPAYGAIVVIKRNGGSGYHVGTVVGQDPDGRLVVMGGNQGDEYCTRSFGRALAAAYRWPPGEPLPALATLPMITNVDHSRTEQ